MSCVSLPKLEAESTAPDDREIGWNSIIRGIRIYAVHQPHDVAIDLFQWADFLEGVAEIEARD